MKQSRKKTARLSEELGPSSLAPAISMDSATGDGLSAEGMLQMTAVSIATPHGEVASNPMPSEDAVKMRGLIESELVRIERLTLDTPDGVVIIPGDVLRQSLIRFWKMPADQPAGSSPSLK
ncbi:hypothetical protein [Hydrocarboniphaga effusa]|uniref:hypothetical protein n=1 Tax=Hydrocarboniphaga effusa TaxID=243629 RepID=UPI003138154F